jgi:hypothetical protein
LSQSDLRAHFGLGSSARIDSVEVTWPNGGKQQVHNIKADQFYVIEEGKAGVKTQVFGKARGKRRGNLSQVPYRP